MATPNDTDADNATAATGGTDPNQDEGLNAAERWMKLVALPTLLVLGTAGNALVIIVLAVRRLKPHPTSLLLAFLSIFDTMVLWTGVFRQLYMTLYPGSDFRSESSAMCKIHTQMTYFSFSVSVWTLVVVTSHRFIAVYFPLQAKTLLTMRRTWLALFVTIIFFFVFNIHIYWTVGLMTYDGETYCFHLKATEHFMNEIWPKMDLITNSITPFILLLVFNGTIIYKVRTGPKLLSKDTKDFKSSNKANTAMTVMLISVNVIFLVTTAPFALYNTDAFKPPIVEYSSLDNLLFTTFYIFQGINPAANFYIYCLSGQKFREELKITLTMCCGRNDKRQRDFGRSMATSTSRTTTVSRVSNNATRYNAAPAVNGHATATTATATAKMTAANNAQREKPQTAQETGETRPESVPDISVTDISVQDHDDEQGIVNNACEEVTRL